MANSTTTRIRTTLHKLRERLLHPDLEKTLGQDNTIPDEFLKNHKIQLRPYTFSESATEDENLGLQPPVYFRPRSPEVLSQHPIDRQGYYENHPREKGKLNFKDYQFTKDTKAFTQWDRAEWLSSYLIRWALRGFQRRGLPEDAPNLHEFCGIDFVM